MKLPAVEHPERYRGLYVFDFGDWTALGYTAEEVALLLESEDYRGGKVYRIHGATPDGRFELRGVAPERFAVESAMCFFRESAEAARADFDDLCALADRTPPPLRAFVHLAGLGESPAGRYATVLVYPSEGEDDVAAWLLDAGYVGGDTVEGGVSAATGYYQMDKTILDRRQLVASGRRPARSREELLASVRRAVQC